MFGRNDKFAGFDGVITDNMVWLCDKRDSKRYPGQWMREDWHQVWIQRICNGFHLLGMEDRYRRFTEELVKKTDIQEVPHGMVQVQGWRMRHSLRLAMVNLPDAFPEFRVVPIQGGKALVFSGKMSEALHVWRAIAELLAKTMVAAIVTDALSHYVAGTQVGYSPKTRHLFKRGNTVRRLGTPDEPKWELNISDYQVVLGCPWDKAANTQRELGYSLLQQMQLALNNAMEQVLKREG